MSATTVLRDRDAEALWLESLRERSGAPWAQSAALVEQVMARLDAVGPTIDVRPVAALRDEIAEELADVLAWALVLLQSHPIDSSERATLRTVCTLAVTAHGFLADPNEGQS